MSDADVIRSTLSDLLERSAEEAILAPGALIALRLFFHQQEVYKVLLSDREYYAAGHFPDLEVHVAPFGELTSAAERLSPDAVVASLVSWRGRVGDVASLCDDLRKRFRGGFRAGRTARGRPLICVDWCHAGAAGFPSAVGVRSDVLFGDVSKWLIPARAPDRLAFLLGTEDLSPSLRSCFEGLHASGGGRAAREARWVDGRTLEEVARSVEGTAADRKLLRSRHEANMKLARTIAEANDHPAPASALLWFPGVGSSELELGALPSPELAWDTGAGVRVLCQAEGVG
ncbi:MAG: hypothetical protein ACOC8K_00915 [Gemmatimonadota bacterium]